MKWFILLSVVLAGALLGIVAHEGFHYINGYDSSVCFGTKLMQGNNQTFMNSSGFYVFSNSLVEHFSRNENIAWAIQLIVMLAFVYAGHLRRAWY